MRDLKDRLEAFIGQAVHSETRGLPSEWERRILDSLPFQEFWSLSLLACASAQWKMIPPERGIPSAAAVLLLAGSTAVHGIRVTGAPLPGLSGFRGGGPPEAGQILAGDAMIPLAARVLLEHSGTVSLHLTGLLMKTAAGILEAMSFGRHADMTGGWWGRLSSLAARMGTVVAGSPASCGETAALAGLALGRASAVLQSGSSRDCLVEAERILKETIEPLGPEARLFRQIAEFTAARGTGDSDDLFAGLAPP